MKGAALSVLVAAALALGAGAQQQPAPLARTPLLQALTVSEPGAAMLSFRSRGRTKVELLGTERARAAAGKAEIEARTGTLEIKIDRGDIEDLPPPASLGNDYRTYVLWVVTPDGAAANAGEILFDGERSEEVRAATGEQSFWLMVTAEPDFAVQAPSPAVVLVSRSQEETRTSNKAATLESPLFYFTPYTDYDSQPAAQPLTGVAPEFQQARKALQLATRATESFQDADEDATLAEEARARALLRYAENMLQGGETEGRDGNWPLAIQWARTATQLAEAARALAAGVTGTLPARRLRRELEQLRSENARMQGQLAETQQQLTSLGDRGTQLEAELDAERRRTRELDGQLLALRERISVLEELFGATRQRNAFLEEERNKLCTELRRQLDSVGKLTEQAGHLVLTLSSDILFDFNRFNLRPGARENLAKLAVVRRLLFADVPVRFEGHTDLTGEEDYNQWLSEQRALAVYRYFLEAQAADTTDQALRTPLAQRLAVVRQLLDMGFNASRRDAASRQEMLALLDDAVVGKGMREPVVPEQGRNEQNRRVTLVFPEATTATPSPLCASAPVGTSSRLSQ